MITFGHKLAYQGTNNFLHVKYVSVLIFSTHNLSPMINGTMGVYIRDNYCLSKRELSPVSLESYACPKINKDDLKFISGSYANFVIMNEEI